MIKTSLKKQGLIKGALFSLLVMLTTPSAADYFKRSDDAVKGANQYSMNTLIQARFREDVVSIKQAVEFLLEETGYRLGPYDTNMRMSILMARPLPDEHRSLPPMTVYEAIDFVTGRDFKLMMDLQNKTAGFVTREELPSVRYVYAKKCYRDLMDSRVTRTMSHHLNDKEITRHYKSL